MPAQDKYHDVVKRALQKAGWEIVSDQVSLIVEDRYLYLDIQAQSADDQIILVEVKGFENLASPIAYFEQILGQYLLYRLTLSYLEIDYPLYLAVPEDAHTGVLQEKIFAYAIAELEIHLLVFDPQSEEIIQWQQ